MRARLLDWLANRESGSKWRPAGLVPEKTGNREMPGRGMNCIAGNVDSFTRLACKLLGVCRWPPVTCVTVSAPGPKRRSPHCDGSYLMTLCQDRRWLVCLVTVAP